jgi:S-adenosylmethionine synthetase
MTHYLFTSEAVGPGHPDKIADQISDAILDACLSEDKESKVACEVLCTTGLVLVAGEITTSAKLDVQEVVRSTIKEIGYDDCDLGFDYRSCGIIVTLGKQSPDIAQGVVEGEGLFKEQGAGDQGIMFGYACDETPELMPLPIMLANKIIWELTRLRKSGELAYLRPDAKSQITLEYDEEHRALRLHTAVISTQHDESVKMERLTEDMKKIVKKVVPKGFIDEETKFFINPTGRFVIGGPVADTGLTGRKPAVDTYGGMGRHGGGAFSGKDPTKVDRSASYAARYVAKNLVAAKLAKRCEVQLAYAIGVPEPVSVKVDTFGTGEVAENLLAKAVMDVFDLSPRGIIEMLDLKRPIYLKTACGGHFGKEDQAFTWEKTDKASTLRKALLPT